MRRAILRRAAASSAVMSGGTSATVQPYGHITWRPYSWNETATRTC